MSSDLDDKTRLADRPAAGYDTYTDSGVDWLGTIPAHWETVRLKHAVNLNPSKSEVRDLPDEREVSFVPMEAIHESGGLDLGKTKELGEVVDGYTYFRENDVLVAKITPCFENRKGALATELKGGVGFGTTELHVLRPTERIDRDFLFYSTMSAPFRKRGAAVMYGAGGQKRVPDDFIENLRWPLPPPDEQRAIANFLDRATARIDALIDRKERLIDLLEEKRSALVSHVVTTGLDDDAELQDSGVEWLGEIPAGWETAQLRHLIRPDTTITYGIVQAGTHMEDGIPYIRTGDMKGRSLPEDGYKRTDPEIDAKYSRSKLEAGDIVVAIRATVGKALQVPEYLDGANLTQGTARVAPGEEVSNRFLLWAINARPSQQRFDALSKGATFDEITLDMLRRLEVPLPPLDEQRAIADHLDETTAQIDTLIERVQDGVERLREYRTALLSAAVTGEIDVREAVRA